MWRRGFWFSQELSGGALQLVEDDTCTAAGRGRGSRPRTPTKLRIEFGGVLLRDTVNMGSGKDCGCWFWFTVLPDSKPR